jgi:trigger factor
MSFDDDTNEQHERRITRCRSCHARIIWFKTDAGKNMPVDASWFTDQAVRRVKLGLLLAELVKEQNLHAKPEQVRAIVDDYAQTFEDPKEVVRWYYSQPQRLAEAEALALENNVVEWMLANAKAVDKAVSFDELMGNAA